MPGRRSRPEPSRQLDLFLWGEEVEREAARVAALNAERSSRRGFLVFATNPAIHPDAPGYRRVFATEAKTQAQAIQKVRPLVPECRLRAYLATGRYRDELATAEWVG